MKKLHAKSLGAVCLALITIVFATSAKSTVIYHAETVYDDSHGSLFKYSFDFAFTGPCSNCTASDLVGSDISNRLFSKSIDAGVSYASLVPVAQYPINSLTYDSVGNSLSFFDYAAFYDHTTGAATTTIKDTSVDFNSPAAQPTASAISATITQTTVPEPASLALLGIGLVGLGISRKRKHNIQVKNDT